jgi:uncharacterized membrane protein
MGKNRLEAFSGDVIAIIMIMVWELKVDFRVLLPL